MIQHTPELVPPFHDYVLNLSIEYMYFFKAYSCFLFHNKHFSQRILFSYHTNAEVFQIDIPILELFIYLSSPHEYVQNQNYSLLSIITYLVISYCPISL